MKTTFLSEVSQFLLTKETVTDSWRILRHVTLGHRRYRAQLKFWFGQNCIDVISHRIFPRTTHGYKGDLNAKVNQKAPGKMRCKFIMETIEFFKSKTKKKRQKEYSQTQKAHNETVWFAGKAKCCLLKNFGKLSADSYESHHPHHTTRR